MDKRQELENAYKGKSFILTEEIVRVISQEMPVTKDMYLEGFNEENLLRAKFIDSFKAGEKIGEIFNNAQHQFENKKITHAQFAVYCEELGKAVDKISKLPVQERTDVAVQVHLKRK